MPSNSIPQKFYQHFNFRVNSVKSGFRFTLLHFAVNQNFDPLLRELICAFVSGNFDKFSILGCIFCVMDGHCFRGFFNWCWYYSDFDFLLLQDRLMFFFICISFSYIDLCSSLLIIFCNKSFRRFCGIDFVWCSSFS